MSENTDIEGRLELRLQAVTPVLFRPYGHLVSAGAADPVHVNAGTALRYDIARIDADTRPASRLIASVFETAPQALPLVVRMMERHVFSQQAIVAMHAEEFVLAVALDDGKGRPDPASLRAFHFRGGGVVYRRGIWHTPIIGLGAAGRFFVQSWQAGTTEDCEEQIIAPFVVRGG